MSGVFMLFCCHFNSVHGSFGQVPRFLSALVIQVVAFLKLLKLYVMLLICHAV